MDRRTMIGAAAGLAASIASRGRAAPLERPALARVIIDNDFAGDPDGLFQLAHHLLCPSLRFPLIIGSHLPRSFASGHDASDGADRAREILSLLRTHAVPEPMAGAENAISARNNWTPSPASAAIVREALREDAHEPLIYAAGAGLTDLALAWLSEPRIGRKIRLVWIGGNPHGEVASAVGPEFNFSIDPVAAQVIFNESDIEIWQVPSDGYGAMLFSNAELEELGGYGGLGAYLKARVDAVPEMVAKIPGFPPMPRAEAYVLGDSPLVTLTALVSPLRPEPTSSSYRTVPTPRLSADGTYAARPDGRPMRIYTAVDSSLTFRDMLARFRLHAGKGKG